MSSDVIPIVNLPVTDCLIGLIRASVADLDPAIEACLAALARQVQAGGARIWRLTDAGLGEIRLHYGADTCPAGPVVLRLGAEVWAGLLEAGAAAGGCALGADAVSGLLGGDPARGWAVTLPLGQGLLVLDAPARRADAADMSSLAHGLAAALQRRLLARTTPADNGITAGWAEPGQSHQTLSDLVLDVMGNLVVRVDRDLRVQWCNAAFSRHTGWPLDEIRGRRLDQLVRVPESEAAAVEAVYRAVAREESFQGEMINQDRWGNRYWVAFNVQPLHGADGSLQGFVSVETVITEQKTHEAEIAALALRETAARARLISALDSLGDGVMVLDRDLRIALVNQGLFALYPSLASVLVEGTPVVAFLRKGVTLGLFCSKETPEATEAMVQERLATYLLPEYREDVILPDGRCIRRLTRQIEGGGVISLSQDISDDQRRARALEAGNRELTQALAARDAAERRLAVLLEGAGVATWELDIAAQYVTVGGQYARNLGEDPARLGGLTNAAFRARVHPDDLARMDASVEEDFAHGSDLISVEFRMRHREGHWVWVLSRGRVTARDDMGRALLVAGVHVDITEQRALRDAVSEGRLFLETVMETSPVAIVLVDGAGLVTFCNTEAEKVLARSRDQILGQSWAGGDWQISAPDGTPFHPTDLPAPEEIAQDPTSVRDFQATILLPDGQRRVLLVNLAQVEREGRNRVVIAAFSDVTEAIGARLKLEEAVANSEAASQAKSAFLANMSHEIRTPLNGILGMSDLLRTQLRDPAQRRMVDTIRAAGDGLLAVLDAVLDMSKIEAGRMVLEDLAFVPRELLDSIEPIYAAQAQEKGLEFEALGSLGTERPRRGDALRLRQILHNLLNNALKFTERGRVEVLVSAQSGRPMAIEVNDTGCGMSEVQLSRIFDSFMQADDSISRRYGGSGLGLSIVRQLVEMMGGTISVQSRIGEGTRIRVSLPLAEDSTGLRAVAE